MTPIQHKLALEEERIAAERKARVWHVPLKTKKRLSLKKAIGTMELFRLRQEEAPLIIKLIENPKYRTSKLFSGAVSLHKHDCIHILLGRGVLAKDEAFVIGYIMGSANKMKRWRRNLFMFFAKYLYPKGYRFGEEERFVFNMGVKLGSILKVDLSVTDFKKFEGETPRTIRQRLGVDENLLMNYYLLEKVIFPDSPESQRLLKQQIHEEIL